MKELLNQEFEIPCPGGGTSKKMKLDKILSSPYIRTSKGEYILNYSDKSRIKSHLRVMDRKQKELQKELFQLYAKMLGNSKIIIKG